MVHFETIEAEAVNLPKWSFTSLKLNFAEVA